MWTKLAGIILRNRIFFICLLAVGTILMGTQIGKLEMSYENAQLLPETDSAFIDYKNFLETFGQEGDVMVFAVQDTDFFEQKKLQDWIEMGKKIKEIDGVTAFVSIAHTYNISKNEALKKFEITSIFPDTLIDQVQIDSLAQIAYSLPFYDGMLLNKETHTYGAMITVEKAIMNSPARVPLVNEIRAITESFSEKHNIKIHYSGMPYIRVINAENIKHEMYMFIAFSLLITSIILYIFFRSFRIVSFCVIIIGISVVWALGFMALLHIKITLLTAMLPPLLIVIGIPNCVFMLNKYQGEYMHHGNKIKALQRVIQKIGSATLLANLTTAAGFATFIVTSSQILKDFGLIASISIASVFIICLILIPTIFSFLPKPDSRQMRHLRSQLINRLTNKIVVLIMHYRASIYCVMVVIVGFAGFGISLMKTTGYMVDDLKETDPIRQDLSFFEENFNGLMPLEVTIDFHKPNQAFNLNNLEKVNHLSNEISKDEEVSRPLSIVEAVKFANQAYYNGKPSYYKLPSNISKNFIMKYAQNSTGSLGGNTKGFVDSLGSQVRLNFRVKDVGTKKMLEKEAKLHEIAEKIFPKDKADVTVTGSSLIFSKGTQYLTDNLFSSLALAIILIAGFMAWMFRSKRMVLIALVPNIIPQLITAAIMGYFGVPIKASTILVFSIAFGISVDDTIHYLAKYRQELMLTNWNLGLSVIHSLKETAQSMIYTSVILFFGFGIFCLSDFGGTFALGLLTAITLFFAMLSNLVVLPSLLLTHAMSINKKTYKEPYLQICYEEEDIDPDKLSIQEDDTENK